MVCRTWSVPTIQPFTGLCSMLFLIERENDSSQCEVCVDPTLPEGAELVEEISEICRTWHVPSRYFNPLCCMMFYADSGVPSCPICAQAEEV